MVKSIDSPAMKRIARDTIRLTAAKPHPFQHVQARNEAAVASRPLQRRFYSVTQRFNTAGDLLVSNQASFLAEFLQRHEIPQQSIDHFSRTAWTQKILQSAVYELIPFYSRYLDDSTGESRFFAATVNTSTTVPHVVCMRCRHISTPQPLPAKPELSAEEPRRPEILALMHLGRDLEAHPGIVNGGFQSVLFDEVMYCVILQHAHNLADDGPRPKHYTLDLTTRFVAPVRAGTDVVIRAGLSYRIGRKWQLWAEIVDSKGNVLTTAKSLWITAKKPHGPTAED